MAAAPSAPSTPYASASLYVGDLAPDVTEALLFEIFNAVGPVASVRVCRDAATRRSLGYAYVNFGRAEDAERALDTMNFKNIRAKPCRIMWSHRDPSLRKSGLGNIFVKNLAKSIDNKTLFDTFSMFGNILSCKVAVNAKRESLGYGFVHYETEEAAAAAIARVNGKLISGEKVTVAAFKSKKERGGANKFRFTNVYVKNLPLSMSKEEMNTMFGKYGTITSSTLSVEQDGKSRGFGFVNFENPEDAQAAVDALHDTEIEGKKLYVSRAQKKEEREKELREKFEALKLDRQKKYAGVNLYVKNLADNIDDNRLREEFSKCGSITSCRVMRDSADKSRGFGFVCFSTPDEATKAVTEMNGHMVEMKPLYVALAQRKDVRRAQLEAQHAARAKLGGVPQPQMYNPAPMYYHPQQRMMYPQQMVPRRFQPHPSGGPMVAMRQPPAPGGFQLMPMAGGRGGPAPGGRGGAGRRPGRQQQPGGPAGAPGGPKAPRTNGAVAGATAQAPQPAGQQQQQPAFKYTNAARNAVPGQPQPAAPEQPAPVQQAGALTVKALASANDEQKKQMIGEQLYPLIKAQKPDQAGKITGMLLEMDNGELIHLLESHTALTEKINEAMTVLESSGSA